MDQPLKYTELAKAAEISLGHAHDILSTRRTPSRPLAITIWRKTGHKFPPIAHLSDDDIEALARIDARAAA